MITFRHKGDFSKTTSFLKNLKIKNLFRNLDEYGKRGVVALASATPLDSGLTASSWGYRIEQSDTHVSLIFYNTNIQNGVPIAVILQYGHGTGTGGWVEGRDYINPAIQPVFDQILKEMWGEVTK